MGYRMFCDRCDKETPTNYVSHRVAVILDGWKAEVMLVTRHDLALSTQVLCEACFREVLREGKVSQLR